MRAEIDRFVTRALTLVAFVLFLAAPAAAADRDKLDAFLRVTGFDVALDSIALSASSAPEMLGMQASDFGADWARVSAKVFDTGKMRAMAVEILEAALTDDVLAHAAAFYATDLGQRLVAAENASHMMKDDSEKDEEGRRIVADLVEAGAPRVAYLNRLNAAVDSADSGLRAIQEIQIRFLMAAAAAGVIDLTMEEDDMREALKQDEAQLRTLLQLGAMANAAYTYRDFNDAEVQAYAEALEHPTMQTVYELMNAVQYEIMANRFEVLAGEMADLHPVQEL